MRINGKQTDRRIVRTKKEILNALTLLLEQKTIDEITVKEITDLAGINRGTFYLHYVDKYDLMEKSVNQLILEMREIGTEILSLTLTNKGPENVQSEIEDMLTALFEYIKEHQRFVKSLTGEKGNYSFHIKFNEFLKDTFIERVDANHFDIPPVYAISAISYGMQGIIQTWLHEGLVESPAVMSQHTFKILSVYLTGLKY